MISPVSSSLPVDAFRTPSAPKPGDSDEKLGQVFQDFVGQTLFGQMLKSMRKTVHKNAYFHGGRAEEVFQQQLDQVLAEKLSRTSAERLSEPMWELFQLERR